MDGPVRLLNERKEIAMRKAGLSKAALERMHRVLSGHIERQDMPGMVALVSHHADVHVETLGTLAFDDPALMRVTRSFGSLRSRSRSRRLRR
jgi:hypothetical protein